MPTIRTILAVLLALVLLAAPAAAARPIVDLHKLDAYFALFASDSNVPWQATTVRLDTYSSAPVQFAVYQVDPADVLTAGSNARPRAIDTRGRRPVVAFSFTPPGGYQFQSSEVDVRLGSRQGFFVVEARRGDVGEQVWINRTRVGLVTKETPGELLLYATDLGTGHALPHMRVAFVVENNFVTRYTDGAGIVRWNRSPRPVFALAQWGDSFAFASFLPQAPLPRTIVGVRTDTAVVHAGGTVRVAGFARTRAGAILKPASGNATITMRLGGTLIAQADAPVDAAGAFTADIPIPSTASAGDYAVLAQIDGGVGGAAVHVDADADGLSLEVSSGCAGPCDPSVDVPVAITSSRGGVRVHVAIVRSPHVYVDYSPEFTPWGTSAWLNQTVTTDAQGHATVMIPHPTDGLASTYGVRVDAGGASAVTRILVPTGRDTVRLQLDRDQQTLGTPVNFDVFGNDVVSGAPLAGARVTLQLQHGPSTQEQVLTLDRDGHAHGTFTAPSLGTNFVFATIDGERGTAMDAGQVDIVPQATQDTSLTGSSNVRITLDRSVYRAGEDARVTAHLDGAQGDALLTIESAMGAQTVVAPVHDGEASATMRITDAAGDLRVGAVLVHDGAIAWSSVPLDLDAPGRPIAASVGMADAQFLPGASASVTLNGAMPGAGTTIVRISRGAPSGGALFESVPALLAVGLAATQVSAPEGRTWHPWVDSTGEHAQVIGFERRSTQPQNLSLEQADTQAVWWNVQRGDGSPIAIVLPAAKGRYTLSILRIDDDGRVIAASSPITVQ
ncbi:MAG TPA: hypothetical protein VMF11_02700 [Candidatus Baltobacteraceae bacterium]|nr:hypothetical protein [Candidatus Baltobacteraceae bacterium]